MNTKFAILLLSVFSAATGFCQSASISETVGRDWGGSVAGVRLSVVVTNTIIPSGSGFSVFAEVENTSTNNEFVGDSGPTVDFSVFLTDNSGRSYRIVRAPFSFMKRTSLRLPPGAIFSWTIPVNTDRYYEPPGYIATIKSIPRGDYSLNATRNFYPADLKSNVIRVRIR